MGVLIGIDPHKATNAVAAIDERGELLEYAVFSTNRAGLRSLETSVGQAVPGALLGG